MSKQKQEIQFVRSPFVTTWAIDDAGILLYIDSDDEIEPRYILPAVAVAGIRYGVSPLSGRYQSVVHVLIGTTGNWTEAYKSRANFSTRLSALENAKNAATQLAEDLWGDWIIGPESASEIVPQKADSNFHPDSDADREGKGSQTAKSSSRRATKQKEAPRGE